MPLEPRELNRRIAERLGMELGARTEEEISEAASGCLIPCMAVADYVTLHFGKVSYSVRMSDYGGGGDLDAFAWRLWQAREGQSWKWDIENLVANWRQEPPDWATDLETANTLENELINRHKTNQFIYALRNIVLKGAVGPSDVTEYYICFASAYDRAAAALLALGGSLDDVDLDTLPPDPVVTAIGMRVLSEYIATLPEDQRGGSLDE